MMTPPPGGAHVVPQLYTSFFFWQGKREQKFHIWINLGFNPFPEGTPHASFCTFHSGDISRSAGTWDGAGRSGFL